LPIGMHVPWVPALRSSNPLIMMLFIQLHMPLQIFMAIESKMKEISLLLVITVLAA
jgi:hypothetical protein